MTTTSSVSIGRKPSAITLTDGAIAKVTDLIAQEGNDSLVLRVAVRPGGCSGYSYEMFFDSELTDDDVVATQGTVKVAVDTASAELLKGASLDYTDGLQGAGFHISNPNATRTCGCGSSFS
ncbi:MAG TPA: iron-sulfur cluster insertion protein ErpA [Acidimicrobiales bacterium]|nr:iron-sulfur cluster insertion protein ErpA [Acidimicrobiales bacterium]